MPELKIWHTASLSKEFTAHDATPNTTLRDYIDQEERLFHELKEKVYDRVASTDDLKFCRYRTGGPQNPKPPLGNWNRTIELVPERIRGGALILPANEKPLKHLETRSDLPYRLTIITNMAWDSNHMVQRTKAPRSGAIDSTILDLAWPHGVYSLTHVAVQFSPDDPVYGANENSNDSYQGLPLGRLQPRGEAHLLTAPLRQIMRLRYNPFFGYLEQRVVMEIDHKLTGGKK
jgi:hypothetical protein